MSDQPFSVGDIVMVKSGSPMMTVEAVRENQILSCLFYVNGMRHNEDHPSAVLEHYVPTPSFVHGGFRGPDDF